MFRILNAARRSAVTSHPPYLTTLMRAHQPNNNTIALTKAPLLSVLTNYGATVPAIVLHLAPGQTGYKPLIPVIDVLTEQIFATDPRGGLTVPIVGGQPRVFLPLAVHRGAASKSVWQGSALVKVDTSVAQDSKGHSTPGGSHRKTPSFGRVLSWLGSVGQSKNSDL
jgi:alpha-amylase